MKRRFTLVWGAAVAAAAVLAALPARPAESAPIGGPPILVPNFVEPILFEGFEPIAPDEFGTSPKGEFMVYEDERGFHVIRLHDGVELFQDRILDYFEVGFTPSENRLFLLEHSPGDYRLRVIELDKKDDLGETLFDQRFLSRPEIRTDLDGFVNLVATIQRNQTRVLVFDHTGFPFFQQSFTEQVRWGINLHSPVVAFVDPIRNGEARVKILNVKKNRVTFQDTARFPYDLGFEPGGPAFVLASSGGLDTFRVVLVDGENGRRLLTRTFSGPLNVGFTPDGGLLGVVGRIGLSERVYLFRTNNGRLVPGF